MIQVNIGTDFRLFLQRELAKRCQDNPSYSLRAFAKFLRIESSALSKILNNKRNITPRMLKRLAERFELDPVMQNHFSKALPSQNVPSPKQLDLDLDQFHLIRHWYHFAILELTQFQDFASEPKWIATQLGINVNEVNFALERLERMGMICWNETRTTFTKAGNFTTTKSTDTAIAMRQLQKDILDQAKRAMDDVPTDMRENATITVATSRAKIALAKQLMRDFRRQLSDLLDSPGDADTIYQISTHLFPVNTNDISTSSKTEEKRKKHADKH